MSGYPARVRTMRVLVDSNPILKSNAMLTAITGELNSIERATRNPVDHRWLLTLLHTTRALDTTLRQLCNHKGWTDPAKKSLGSYLISLGQHLPTLRAQFSGFQRSVADPRNKYIHPAGATPTRQEFDRLLAEMHSCMSLATTHVI